MNFSGVFKIITNTSLYTLSTFLLRASSIIFFPIFSLYLTDVDYGILSITQSIALIIGVMAGLGINRSITRFIYYESEKSNESHSSIIFTSLFSSFTIQALFVILVIVFNRFIPQSFLNEIEFFPYIFVAIVAVPFNSIIEVAKTYFKSVHQGKKVFYIDMSFFSLNILFNLFFVVVLGFDVLGIFYGILINTLIFSGILYFIFYRKLDLEFNPKLLKKILRYCLPLVPYAILNIVFEACDKFYLNSEYGTSYSGLYYIVIIFASIFSSFKESIITALTPYFYENIDDNVTTIKRIINWVFLISGFIEMTLSFFSLEILTILSSNPTFVNAHIYIPFTIISFYLILFGNLFNIKTYYFGKYTDYLFIATLVGLIVEVIACYLLIPKYNILGATLSRLIAFSAHVLVLFYLSYKETQKREIYDYQFLIVCCIIMSSIISLPYFINLQFSIFINIIIKVSFIGCLISCVYLFKRKEINLFISSFVKTMTLGKNKKSV